MLLTSVHIATSAVAALLLATAPSTTLAQSSSPSTNTWGGCAMCPAEPPTCDPGCGKCIVTLGSCTECASAKCATAADEREAEGGLGPLGEDPINAPLPGVSVGTEASGPGLPGMTSGGGGVVESSDKKASGAGKAWQVTRVATLGAVVVAGAILVA